MCTCVTALTTLTTMTTMATMEIIENQELCQPSQQNDNPISRTNVNQPSKITKTVNQNQEIPLKKIAKIAKVAKIAFSISLSLPS